MGYTHYWSGTPNLSINVVADIVTIIKASGVKLGDWQGKGGPILGMGEVAFNGFGDESYETFRLDNPVGSAFCKTGRAPYDVVVGAVLLRVRESSPEFTIGSDGDWDDEWAEYRDLYQRALGRETLVAGLDD